MCVLTGCGVIGNTTDFGSVISGSSPDSLTPIDVIFQVCYRNYTVCEDSVVFLYFIIKTTIDSCKSVNPIMLLVLAKLIDVKGER